MKLNLDRIRLDKPCVHGGYCYKVGTIACGVEPILEVAIQIEHDKTVVYILVDYPHHYRHYILTHEGHRP